MTKAQIHEALTILYLRLAGYFTTGLVVHSAEWGQNQTEIDCLAIRFPHHQQAERQVSQPKFLDLSAPRIDLLICEVKSSIGALQFNHRLRTDSQTLRSVLAWAGVFEEAKLPAIVERIHPLMQAGIPIDGAREGITRDGVRIRGLLSCPPCDLEDAPKTWFLSGKEILRFSHECFNPRQRRSECSTRYDFQLWGELLSPIVDYIKSCPADKAPTLSALYDRVCHG